MKIKLYYISLLISFTSFFAQGQDIAIEYYIGIDCTINKEGIKQRGGCITKTTIRFEQVNNKNKFKAKELKIHKDNRIYDDGKWSKNTEIDSLSILKISKRIKEKEFLKLVEIFKLIDFNGDGFETITNKVILTKWNLKTFKLNRFDILKLKIRGIDKGSLFQKLKNNIIERNSGLKVISYSEILTISFKVDGNQYKLIQQYCGEDNLNWKIEMNGNSFYIISPELNKIISKMLPKEMKVKRDLLEFCDLDVIEKIIKTR